MDEIKGIKNLFESAKPLETQKKAFEKDNTFYNLFNHFLNYVNEEQQKAESTKKAILDGKNIPLHDAVVQFEKASVSLSLLLQVRNKLLDAYTSLVNTQI